MNLLTVILLVIVGWLLIGTLFGILVGRFISVGRKSVRRGK
jgi:hypothetical protein